MGYLAPGSFPVMISIGYVVMAAIGGLGTISGGVVGSAVVLVLEHTLSRLATSSGMPASAPVILSYAVYAVLLIAATLFLPGGVVSIVSMVKERISRRARRSAA
jgi:branched-chain amino acid transport system permease protein